MLPPFTRRLLIGLALFTSGAFASESRATEWHFATVPEAAEVLAGNDGFFEAMAPAEIRLRALGPEVDDAEALRRQFRDGAIEWSGEERARLQASLARLAPSLTSSLALLPSRIMLVKIGEAVEDGIPHTRRNAIFLPAIVATLPEATLDSILAHEIFHVLSRNQAARRDSLYALIGFRPCRLQLPDSVRAARITNPDAPEDAHHVSVPGHGDYVPLLMTRSGVDAPPPALGESLQAKLLAVDATNGVCTARTSQDGAALLFAPSAVPALMQVLGPNSDYVSHPEELLADNYALLVTRRAEAPDQAVLDRLEDWLEAASSQRP